MVILAKFLIGIHIVVSLYTFKHSQKNQKHKVLKVAHVSIYEVSDSKTAAFKILENKCNVCHKKRNPFMIFKLKNMDKRAKKIYKQVFVKKRMPKGDEIKLTVEEYKVLEEWLKTNLTI